MPMIRRAFELTEQATGGPNQNSAAMRVQYAQAMTRAGQYEGAIAFLDAATPIIDAQLGAESDRALAERDTRLVALLGPGRGAEESGRAPDRTPVTHAHPASRLPLEKRNKNL